MERVDPDKLLYLFFLPFCLLFQIKYVLFQLFLFVIGLIQNFTFDYFAVLQLNIKRLQFYPFLPFLDLFQPRTHHLLLSFYSFPLSFILLCLVVLLIFFIDSLGNGLVESIEVLDGGVYEMYELHFELEGSTLLQL